MDESIREHSNSWENDYISRAFLVYAGSISFDHWLNLQTTTRSMMRIIENILTNRESIALKYLSKLGKKEDIHEAGIFVGKIYAMLPISVIREIYYKFNSDCDDDKALNKECKRLTLIMELNYPQDRINFFIKEMLKNKNSIEEISNGIIIRFFNVSEIKDIGKIYSRQVRKRFYNKLYSLLIEEKYST